MKPKTLTAAKKAIEAAYEDLDRLYAIEAPAEQVTLATQVLVDAKQDLVDLRKKIDNRNAHRREVDQSLRDLGMTKVRGAVSGKTYWE